MAERFASGGRTAMAAAMLAAALAVAAPARDAAALPGDPPYAESLLRLAEILGALHHLRPLCGANEPQVWRQKMGQLLTAQDPSPDERRRLVERFNQSYRSLAEIHRVCTVSASEIMERYLAEGTQLSRDLVARYGRP